MAEDLKEEEKVIKVEFERENLLKYSENGVEYKMYATKNTGEKIYFGCTKRKLSTSNQNKCTATGIYDISKQLYIQKRHISRIVTTQNQLQTFLQNLIVCKETFWKRNSKKNRYLCLQMPEKC